MTTEETLEQFRSELARDLIADRDTRAPFNPTSFGIHIASSGLQKAIRRGDTDAALRSAARLLEDDPARFWRRFVVIVFEDIGIADVDLVGQVTAVSGQKRWRAAHGGEWFVAANLVTRCCVVDKERTVDDVLHLVEFDDRLAEHRKCWGHADIDRLLEFLGHDDMSLCEKALAAWLGIGTARWRSAVLVQRLGFPNEVFDRFRDLGVKPKLVDVCQVGLGKMLYVLPALLPLVWLAAQSKTLKVVPDDLPHSASIGDMPACVFDGYTYQGKRAIRELVERSTPLRRFLGGRAPRKDWPKIVALILFRVEGGLMTNRLRWGLGDGVREDADMRGRRIDPEAVPEAMAILRSELPRLNEIRARIAAGTEE